MSAAAVENLDNIIQAYDDWTVTYAPEFSDQDAVKAAESRIENAGGVFVYASMQMVALARVHLLISDTLTAEEDRAIHNAINPFADWAVTSKESESELTKLLIAKKRILDGGGTLAYICDHRMALEAIRDRLKVEKAA